MLPDSTTKHKLNSIKLLIGLYGLWINMSGMYICRSLLCMYIAFKCIMMCLVFLATDTLNESIPLT